MQSLCVSLFQQRNEPRATRSTRTVSTALRELWYSVQRASADHWLHVKNTADLMGVDSRPDATMQEVLDSFFSSSNIIKTVHTILSTNKCENSDPIVHVMLQLIQLPLTLALTDVGYAPLRSDTTIIIPFEQMSRYQLQTIAAAVSSLREQQTYVASMQMGGGLYVRAVCVDKTYHVDPALVIFASNVLIRSSVASIDNKKNVSNIVIQRVLGAVNVRHDKIIEAERLSLEHFQRVACA